MKNSRKCWEACFFSTGTSAVEFVITTHEKKVE